ncbi:uncharacterized protein CIMG_00682 [Coccidioides immitis RS]|uniref:Uncharacterized protein n=1 Tax=Coccidioides immitis RMSCC 3703 TaxID=454286 RepID=A0A0J8QSU1_COCIT|nr:uncharacterized protein CIMG_00682 [Coccidioides immitis RS]EAS35328.3 hypothetical protein CIMG_00682 [Coccidioides immitis RS]KMU75904.1 hypothetical protein CISG_05389 [Coccidioides immitis RMSCC 3703]
MSYVLGLSLAHIIQPLPEFLSYELSQRVPTVYATEVLPGYFLRLRQLEWHHECAIRNCSATATIQATTRYHSEKSDEFQALKTIVDFAAWGRSRYTSLTRRCGRVATIDRVR